MGTGATPAAAGTAEAVRDWYKRFGFGQHSTTAEQQLPQHGTQYATHESAERAHAKGRTQQHRHRLSGVGGTLAPK